MLYPTACRVCGAMIESWRDGVACANCWAELEATSGIEEFCVKCGMALQTLPANVVMGERRCGRCDEFAFSVARACGPYDGALRESVLWLKLHPQVFRRLQELLRAAFERTEELRQCESIIPVPLHQDRLAERGFNQAEIIGRALAAVTALRPPLRPPLRVDAAAIVRVKHTVKHSVGMGARERAKSLDNAFQVRAPRLVEDRAVLLVDDVMTTSSTANEIARTLLDAGARSVSVLTLARVMHEFEQ